MKHGSKYSVVILLAACCLIGAGPAASAAAQERAASGGEASDSAEAAIRLRIRAYVDAYNSQDVAAVGSYWSADGVSVNQETGERTSGREALVEELAVFLKENPGARLNGQVDSIRVVRDDVATVEGRTALFVGDADPVESTFTAVLLREDDQWMISSSHERAVPIPASAADALRQLEWLVGEWQDQTDDANVRSRYRWSPGGAFLIRSVGAEFADGLQTEGTQIFGWDPVSKQIRSWTFSSDGSFGQGTVVDSADGWLIRKWQVLSDGRVASATRTVTRVDDDTVSVETIAHTVDGEPVPKSDPVIMVRISDSAQAAAADGEDAVEGASR